MKMEKEETLRDEYSEEVKRAEEIALQNQIAEQELKEFPALQKEIIEIMNKARCYETDRNKTLPFTYKECEKAIELALKSKEKEMLDVIDKLENPYPIDIFPKLELSEFQEQVINDFLISNFRFPLDRLSAELMRRTRNNLKEQLKSSIIGSEEKK